MRGAIAIFVKTPGLSPVKTRLSIILGKQHAEAFHLSSSQATVSVIKSLSEQENVESYYAVAEESALNHPAWQDMPCIWQGEGGLGERMASIYQTLLLDHDYVILVGADIPQMTAKHLRQATTWLPHHEQARLVFAPSDDGGFWLIGGNCDIPLEVWTDVIYSEVDTGTQFFNRIKPLGDIKALESLNDVDEFNDLIQLKTELNNLSFPTKAQKELGSFIDKLDINELNIKSKTACAM